MTSERTVYRPRYAASSGGVVVLVIAFLALPLPAIVAGEPMTDGQTLGFAGFVALGLILAIVPRCFRLVVGADWVQILVLGMRTRTVRAADIMQLEYGNLLHGGLGVGKGLKAWIATSRGRRYFSIGENVYGRSAVEHARCALTAQ